MLPDLMKIETIHVDEDVVVAEVVAVAILIEIKATTRIIILVVEGVIILTVVVARKGIITTIHKEIMNKNKGKTK